MHIFPVDFMFRIEGLDIQMHLVENLIYIGYRVLMMVRVRPFVFSNKCMLLGENAFHINSTSN